MKTVLLLLTSFAAGAASFAFLNEQPIAQKQIAGTAVIAAKTHVKGGSSYTLKLPDNLTPKQGELLAYAYAVAKEDGHKYPEYFQGLIYQESKAGGMKGYQVAGQEFGLRPLERYYGVTQMKLNAVKDVLKKYPNLGTFRTDEELVAKLITDDHWAIRVGSKYFKMICKDLTPEQGLVAYNKGPSGAKGVDPSTNDYATKIVNHSKTIVKQVNDKNRRVLKAEEQQIGVIQMARL